MELYFGFFDLLPAEKLSSYALITLLWLPAFLLGNLVFSLIAPASRPIEMFPSNALTRSVAWIAVPLLLLVFMFAWLGRNSLFGGYGSYDVGVRGKFSTLLVVFNFFMVYQLVCKQKLSLLFITGLFLTCMLLLSMGGRMYVVQTLIVFLVFKTSFSLKRFTTSNIFTVLIIGFVVAAFFGLWRINTSFRWDGALYSFLAEPVFTWFSSASFLNRNEIPLINFPWNFLTSFLNLIPNSVISLNQFVVSTKQMGYDYVSPLGADSVWSTIIINFGSIGSFFFLFITGFVLQFLKWLAATNRFAAVYYISVCSILPFQFFRDGFYIINKQLFFNFLLFPLMILFVLKLLLYWQSLIHVEKEGEISL
ncbi:hypothetical protein HY58_01830 [Flavihumibacter sp. ZG627]|nr:hypothetical protein HY58_01830 [Flavihumibacter sp. ZG627]